MRYSLAKEFAYLRILRVLVVKSKGKPAELSLRVYA